MSQKKKRDYSIFCCDCEELSRSERRDNKNNIDRDEQSQSQRFSNIINENNNFKRYQIDIIQTFPQNIQMIRK